jgi:hypothetical protein
MLKIAGGAKFSVYFGGGRHVQLLNYLTYNQWQCHVKKGPETISSSHFREQALPAGVALSISKARRASQRKQIHASIDIFQHPLVAFRKVIDL